MDKGLDQADNTTPFEEQVVEEGSEKIAWKHAIDEIAGTSAACGLLADVQNLVVNKCKTTNRLRRFLKRHFVSDLSIRGEPSEIVAKLLYADFTTSLGVNLVDEASVPTWNIFTQDLAVATSSVANVFVADRGWYVATTVAEHFPLIHASDVANGFKLHRCLTVLVENGYVRKGAFQEVRHRLVHRTGGCDHRFICWDKKHDH
ncbi:hypothetical protein O6H91_03G119500 [Diphasiastrum complanatum]|uniref:Uncharacterized protein n=3 Tax=Diphasiastrum complanatum TaxID=34168 RepID=A0ACC2EB29_DIPCM|nr:hypothetical protein O6H91_22G017600 [Diphasiastrum complanatum]KAJ7563661.1 hypothetical protein O6H91_03G119500 [Diphasiastrum complanatum]KAJ7563662.1 hypothetical protein O6H91_03G119500 [Diphasiastrum complanatum]